jgi:hypothetical protein
MTELEIVLLCAFGFVLYLYNRTNNALQYYRCAIVAIGLKQATVTVDETDKSFTIEINHNGLEQRISRS